MDSCESPNGISPNFYLYFILFLLLSRTVSYTADPKEGFKAEVVREPTDIVVKVPTPAPQTHQPQQQLFRQAPAPKQSQPQYAQPSQQQYRQQARPEYTQYQQ